MQSYIRPQNLTGHLYFASLSMEGLTGVMTVEKRVQMMPVAVTAHCCGYEILSAGRLKSAFHSKREASFRASIHKATQQLHTVFP